jgi:hypothetical protein
MPFKRLMSGELKTIEIETSYQGLPTFATLARVRLKPGSGFISPGAHRA